MRCSRTKAPSLHRRYPASPVLRASPPPCTARPDPRGLSVSACHATGRASRVASIPLFHTCCRHYPGGTRSVLSSLASRPLPAFPVLRAGRLPHHFVSRPARRSLALQPTWSLSRPRRPVSSECFERCRYLHHPLRLLPAGATVTGRDSHPLGNGALSRRTIANVTRKTPPPHPHPRLAPETGVPVVTIGVTRGVIRRPRHAFQAKPCRPRHASPCLAIPDQTSPRQPRHVRSPVQAGDPSCRRVIHDGILADQRPPSARPARHVAGLKPSE